MYKKLLAAAAVSLLAAVLFSGCSLTADGVKLANKRQITAYVKSSVGDAEFIRSVKGKNKIDYYFREPVTGIEFTASTYAASDGLDGSVFYYYESKNTDFYEKYADLIFEDIEPELDKIRDKYGENVVIEKDVFYRYGGSFIRICFMNYEMNFTEKDVLKIAGDVGNVLEGNDPLGKYEYISLYNGKNDSLGVYDLASKSLISNDYDYDEAINEYFERRIHMHGYAGENKPKKHSEFLRKEDMRVGDIPGIEDVEILQNVMYDDVPNITMDTVVTVYYYKFDGKEYFLADHVHIDSQYDRGKLYISAVK